MTTLYAWRTEESKGCQHILDKSLYLLYNRLFDLKA